METAPKKRAKNSGDNTGIYLKHRSKGKEVTGSRSNGVKSPKIKLHGKPDLNWNRAEKEIDRAVPGIRQFKTNPEPEEILKAVGAVMGEKENLARQVGMYFCHKHSGKKLREIGDLFGVGETAIAEARRLLTRRLEADVQLREEVDKVRAVLGI